MALNDVKKYDNGLKEYELSEKSLQMNPWLQNYGRDRYTFRPEQTALSAIYYKRYEGTISHGYPYTAWWQLALVYACGLYTAKQQGIVKKGVYFQRFWRAHYFDWLLFMRRGLIYGVFGGLLTGTLWFGKPYVAAKRVASKYHYLFSMEKLDVRNSEQHHFYKLNN